MKILAIETSCDETAVAVLECEGDGPSFSFRILGDALLSQADKHASWGGVVPNLAKREHARNLVPILKEALLRSFGGAGDGIKNDITPYKDELSKILEREPELLEQFLTFIPTVPKPNIDRIAVTNGPGLEPALWVGVNFAHALSLVWNIPIEPVNHMEGHIMSAMLTESRVESRESRVYMIKDIQFPVLALLISGGHTELVSMDDWFSYRLIGETRDDAVGEAFDKVARMLGLPYPGGPEISKLAEPTRSVKRKDEHVVLPRPMLHTNNCDFSFSGLKTAVLYTLKDAGEATDELKQDIAREFEDAVVEILTEKTRRALDQTEAKILLLGGGVSANKSIRAAFEEMMRIEFPTVSLRIPAWELSTDNAVMIGIAGSLRHTITQKTFSADEIRAEGNLRLAPIN